MYQTPSNKNLLAYAIYSEVPNRRAGLEKSATLLAYLLSKLINEQGGIFHLLHCVRNN